MLDLKCRSFPTPLPTLDQWGGRRDCPKQGLTKPELPCLARDFPVATWAGKGSNWHLKGKLPFRGFFSFVRAQLGNFWIGAAQAGTVFSGIGESQARNNPQKTPLGWNQQQLKWILVNFGQLLYWETEILTGNVDSPPVLRVLSSAFLLFPASGVQGAPQHPEASLGCPGAVRAGIQSHFPAASQPLQPQSEPG